MSLEVKPYSLILVAVMPNTRDMEIARVLGWYRIPLRSAPKVVDVDYLAFYQTSVFSPDEMGTITYVAQVKGHELTTRGELLRNEADHTRANEEYYKISIGPLVKLPQAIEASTWKRLTFMYTTGEYLLAARKLQDLVVHSEDRSLLWRSLRERLEIDPIDNKIPEVLFEMDAGLAEWLGLIYIQNNNS